MYLPTEARIANLGVSKSWNDLKKNAHLWYDTELEITRMPSELFFTSSIPISLTNLIIDGMVVDQAVVSNLSLAKSLKLISLKECTDGGDTPPNYVDMVHAVLPDCIVQF